MAIGKSAVSLAFALVLSVPAPTVPTGALVRHELPKANDKIVKEISDVNVTAVDNFNEYLKKKEKKRKAAEKARKAKERKLREQKKRAKAQKQKVSSNGWTNLGQFKITHYCSCETCNPGNANRTASGKPMVVGRTVAVDTSVIPLGSKLLINGNVYYAEDTGVIGNKVDVLVNSHDEAYAKGVYHTDVYIMK